MYVLSFLGYFAALKKKLVQMFGGVVLIPIFVKAIKLPTNTKHNEL